MEVYMRVVMFRGCAVKRQRKINENEILLRFYTRPPMIVTSAEWDAEKQNKFYDSATHKRREIIRSL